MAPDQSWVTFLTYVTWEPGWPSPLPAGAVQENCGLSPTGGGGSTSTARSQPPFAQQQRLVVPRADPGE